MDRKRRLPNATSSKKKRRKKNDFIVQDGAFQGNQDPDWQPKCPSGRRCVDHSRRHRDFYAHPDEGPLMISTSDDEDLVDSRHARNPNSRIGNVEHSDSSSSSSTSSSESDSSGDSTTSSEDDSEADMVRDPPSRSHLSP